MMRRRELVAVLPLDIVDDVAAVLAAVQGDRDETRLRRHETGALAHQFENFGLMFGLDLDGRDLGDDAVVFADFGHGTLLVRGYPWTTPRMAAGFLGAAVTRPASARSPPRWRPCAGR